MSDKPGVLLIEDQPLIRAAERMLFEDAGYRVTEITKAADLRNFTACAGEYQAIIADFDLRPDMTGIRWRSKSCGVSASGSRRWSCPSAATDACWPPQPPPACR